MLKSVAYFIESIANALYIFCALGLLVSLRRLGLSGSRLRHAEFVLDREKAQFERATAITWTLAIIELILAIFAITHVVAPTLRSEVSAQPTSQVVANQPFYTSTPPGSLSDIDNIVKTANAKTTATNAGPGVVASSTNLPTPVGTILPDKPDPIGCNTPDAWLEIPANGQVLSDSVTVIGTANTANFAFYKFEISGPLTSNAFATFGGNTTVPVPQKGVLGQLPLAQLEAQPGRYRFRLSVFDHTATLRAFCDVLIDVPGPPTATPIKP